MPGLVFHDGFIPGRVPVDGLELAGGVTDGRCGGRTLPDAPIGGRTVIPGRIGGGEGR